MTVPRPVAVPGWRLGLVDTGALADLIRDKTTELAAVAADHAERARRHDHIDRKETRR